VARPVNVQWLGCLFISQVFSGHAARRQRTFCGLPPVYSTDLPLQSFKSGRVWFRSNFDISFGPTEPKCRAYNRRSYFFQSQVASNFWFAGATTYRAENDEFALLDVYIYFVVYFPHGSYIWFCTPQILFEGSRYKN